MGTTLARGMWDPWAGLAGSELTEEPGAWNLQIGIELGPKVENESLDQGAQEAAVVEVEGRCQQ